MDIFKPKKHKVQTNKSQSVAELAPDRKEVKVEKTQQLENDKIIENDNTEKKWEDLGICNWIISTCKELGMYSPTPIQQNCIPSILQGRDCIGAAPTGSGKTAAFALPIIQQLSEDPYGIFALIITPTRELAFQIGDQFTAIGLPMNIKVEVVVGGKDMMYQAIALAKKPHIVIATPGRIVDHLNSASAFALNRVKYLVLDEADRLLSDEGLFTSVQEILPKVSPKRQTLLFSATMTPTEEQLAKLTLKNPFSFQVGSEVLSTVSTLKQEYLLVPPKIKECYLVYMLRMEEAKDEDHNQKVDDKKKKEAKKAKHGKRHKPLSEILKPNLEEVEKKLSTVIVFTKTCYTAQMLHEMCVELGIRSAVLHSQLTQQNRLESLQRFKSGRVRVLISTDVASRGLDIPTVELVINYDMPREVEDYIHRVGRTARAGRGGRSISMITQYDIKTVHKIEEKIKKQLEEYAPDEDTVLRHLNETTTSKAISLVRLEETNFGERKRVNYMKEERKRGFENTNNKKRISSKGEHHSKKVKTDVDQ